MHFESFLLGPCCLFLIAMAPQKEPSQPHHDESFISNFSLTAESKPFFENSASNILSISSSPVFTQGELDDIMKDLQKSISVFPNKLP